MSRLTINSNMPSMNAQRNFTVASKNLAQSYTRLSSGLRINRAVDDAAGLSISESLKADNRIFNQGIRNLNDGMNVLSIADGALTELSSIATRLNELAIQSSNGALGNKQRLSLDQEAQNLAREYNRIARSTEFNGRKLFDGDFGNLSLAAGGNARSMIVSGLGGGIGDGTFETGVSMAVGDGPLGFKIIDINNDGNLDILSGGSDNILFTHLGNGDGTFRSAISAYKPGGAFDLISADLNRDGYTDLIAPTYVPSYGVMLGNGNGTFKAITIFNSAGTNTSDIEVADYNADGNLDLAINNNVLEIAYGNGDGTFKPAVSYAGSIGLLEANDFNKDGYADIVAQDGGNIIFRSGTSQNQLSSASLIKFVGNVSDLISEDFNKDGNLDLLVTTNSGSNGAYLLFGNGDGSFTAGTTYGYNYDFEDADAGDFNGDGNIDFAASHPGQSRYIVFLGNTDGSFKSFISYNSTGDVMDLKSGDLDSDGALDIVTAAFSTDVLYLHFGNANSGVSALQPFSLRSQYEARDSIAFLRKTLDKLGQQRGKIGAFQSRVEAATNNLAQGSLAISEATSRIVDADIAEESSKLTALQIIQQSAAGVLQQANMQPQLVLQLLNET